MQDTANILPDSSRTASFLSSKLFLVTAGTLFLTASSWVAIPTLPIPITLQTYAVIVVGALFGARMGTAMVLAWLAEAAIGLPVLANGTGGAAVFLGPTAGYLFSFPVAAAVVGWLSDRKFDRGAIPAFLSMLSGNAINLGLGVLWLSTALGWHRACEVGFLPFWTGGVAKAFMATATLLVARKARLPFLAKNQ